MNRIKYFYQDHREQIILAGKYALAIGCVLLSTWLTVGILLAAAAYDIWASR